MESHHLASFARAVRVNAFPPLITIDLPTAREAWNELMLSGKAGFADAKAKVAAARRRRKERRANTSGTATPCVCPAVPNHATSADLSPSIISNNNGTQDDFHLHQQPPRVNVAVGKDAPRIALDLRSLHTDFEEKEEEVLFRVPNERHPNHNNKLNATEARSWLLGDPGWGENTNSSIEPLLCFVLGALVARWFLARPRYSNPSNGRATDDAVGDPQPTATTASSSALRKVKQRMERLEQRLALMEAHQKIAQLQERVRAAQQQHPQPPTSVSPLATTEKMRPHRIQWEALQSSPTSTMASAEEEALLNGMMLATNNLQHEGPDDSSVTSDNSEGNESDVVGVSLQDFQTELETIQENLRTGNFD